ncbi:hypothetical protein Csa_017947 [Cucumis sativus]|nr:hypothetical protein Csa_017947 [Cucumis sativus]
MDKFSEIKSSQEGQGISTVKAKRTDARIMSPTRVVVKCGIQSKDWDTSEPLHPSNTRSLSHNWGPNTRCLTETIDFFASVCTVAKARIWTLSQTNHWSGCRVGCEKSKPEVDKSLLTLK